MIWAAWLAAMSFVSSMSRLVSVGLPCSSSKPASSWALLPDMPTAAERADTDVDGKLSFREGILPPLVLNRSNPPPLPLPLPLPPPLFPSAPSGKLLTSGMPELRLFKVNSSATEG